MKVRRVYFNSRCPVCDAGVAGQRARMASEGSRSDIEWVDINHDSNALADRGVTIDDVRRKLYVEDEQGKLHVGSEAFAALWCETPGQRGRGRLVSLPVLSAVSRWAYNAFAAALYAWNRYRGRW
jgi:predicted DCC family thiol-disulfide oxidoreductase YuxK